MDSSDLPPESIDSIIARTEPSSSSSSSSSPSSSSAVIDKDVSFFGTAGAAYQERAMNESDPPNPEDEANLFQRFFFLWMSPLISAGHKRPLEYEDIMPLRQQDRPGPLIKRFDELWSKECEKPIADRRLWKVCFRFSMPLMGYAVIPKFFYDLAQYVGPVVLNLLIRFLQSHENPDVKTQSVWVGLGYVLLLMCTSTLQVILLHQYFHWQMRTGVRLRSAVIQAVYRKALRIAPGTAGKFMPDGTIQEGAAKSTGQIVNLVQVDAQRCQDVTTYVHVIWSATLQIIVCCVLLGLLLGWSAVAALITMMLFVPLSGFIVKLARKKQVLVMGRKDARIALTTEYMESIKVLKLYAWEDAAATSIKETRQQELREMKGYKSYIAFSRVQWQVAPILVTVLTFGTYILTGHLLDAATAYTSLSLFSILQFPVTMLPMVITALMELRVALGRVQEYLLTPEVQELPPLKRRALGQTCLDLCNARVQWMDGATVIENAQMHLKVGESVAVIGRTGAGKSGLIKGLLGDARVSPCEGKSETDMRFEVSGSIAYVPQEPWILNATVRDNITFGKPFVKDHYTRTLNVCGLKADIKVLPAGDLTEMGEKGVNLSGGQKQRIALARAVYQDADLYLLDDVLSAVDGHVAQHILDRCLLGQLKDKGRLLVTHKVEALHLFQKIIFVANGEIIYYGDYNGLKGLPIYQDYAVEAQKTEEEAQEQIKKIRTASVLSSVAEPAADQSIMSTTSAWSIPENTKDVMIQDEDMNVGAVSIRIYLTYLKACGRVLTTLFLVFYSFNITFQTLSRWWLGFWADRSQPPLPPGVDIMTSSTGFWIYFMLSMLNIVSLTCQAAVQLFWNLSASRKMHDKCVDQILRAPMYFFDTTPIGRIVNRLGKDMYNIDELIPMTFSSYISTGLSVFASFVTIAIATPWFLLASIPLIIVFFLLQRYYIPTSRQVQRIDSVYKSPIFSQLSETVNGVSSIRAYRASERFQNTNQLKVDMSVRINYNLFSSNRWLATRLETLGMGIVVSSALFAVIARNSLSPALGGLAISQALTVTNTLGWMVRQAADLESHIVAVERVQEYTTSIPQEAPAVNPDCKLDDAWPQHGKIEFRDVCMRYRPGLPLVLKGLNVTIEAGEKVGIVGRTGAGKSSLLLCTLRLVELSDGYIMVDGVNISELGLRDLRSRFSIIPQEPVLFTGTLRTNIDPFSTREDHELWEALERAHLKKYVAEEFVGGLDGIVESEGSNLSMGQRQLVCLARALLRRSQILLLDEATSAVDPLTDSLIQDTIRKDFADCTIMSIAHRLNTIMDYDKVLVLGDGNVLECGNPKALNSDRSSIFHDMVKQQEKKM
ncbi:MAG: uncharacterized protein KVP18_001639 [Porospora cf. gigantea A]|uniref:uncharacterized protein n=1 Tax=Porospora cf. gigantea A TaxID=2853593 RepID=UPI00355AB7BF|nr:MAG: hypothetical protein KVP18_001639 [Porospora cf. gigantea A]